MKVFSLNTNFFEFGKGDETVLFLHGWGSDSADFLGSAKFLSRFKRTICVDLWGFGKSEEPKEVWSSEDYVSAIFEFVKQNNLTNLHIVGHSFGGKLGAIFCDKHKEIVKSLVLVDSAGILKKKSLIKNIKERRFKKLKKLVELGKKDEKVLTKFGSDDWKNSSLQMKEIMKKVIREDISKTFSNLRLKTLIFWGKQDRTTPIFMAKKIHKQIKNSTLLIYKGGHFSHIDNFERFNLECLNFWRGL